MKFAKKLFDWLISPLMIGIYISIALSITTFIFFEHKNRVVEFQESGIISALNMAHLKSIDLRFISRGPRKGPKDVALLAIDDKSIDVEGRWPWPRSKIAKMIENATAYGAKVLSFDITFSEPSAQPALKVYNDLKKMSSLPSDVDKKFQITIAENDTDKALARSIEKHKDKIILGVIGQSGFGNYPGYLNACYNLLYQNSHAYSLWENDAYLVAVQDESEFEVPELLSEKYTEILDTYKLGIREQYNQETSFKDEALIKQKIFEAQMEFCINWLDPKNDHTFEYFSNLWPSILQQAEENEEPIEEKTYAEWVNKIKNQYIDHKATNYLSWIMNIDELTLSGSHNGFFTTYQDPDGNIRRTPLVIRSGNHFFPSIALKAFLLANDFNAELEISPEAKLNFTQKTIKKMKITDNNSGEKVSEVPVDSTGHMMINYYGMQKTFPHLPAKELLNDSPNAVIEEREFDPELNRWVTNEKKLVKKAEWLKDKIFIVGATAIGVYDLRVTPFEKNFPGPEIHVNVVGNLIDGNFLKPFKNEEVELPFFVLGVGIILSILLAKLGALYGFILTAIISAGIIYIDKYIYFSNGIVTTIIFPILTVSVIYVIMTFYKYFTEERKKRELKGTFSKYVSPSIVEEVLKNPENLELGGKKIRMSVFFSDVRGFTTISERLDPRALTDLLNSYLTPMTDIVFKNKGTLDKYMGDAVMAFFGAPITYDDHAASACRCALASIVKLKELQEEYRQKGLPVIDIGIGINTGEMNAGNMGSETVRSYTVMGDAVNLGSRLEGITKQYGVRIIISEFTYADVKDDFICREVDWVRVKGKKEPVKIYELIAEKKTTDDMQKVVDHFNTGYAYYHSKDFALAADEFAKALDVIPDDGPSKLYLGRCQDYMQNPPPLDWDGVFVMTTK